MNPTKPAILCLLLAVAGQAQDKNVTVLSQFNPRGYLSGIWGYATTDNAREFAIAGELTGTWIVETTDPRQPIERGFFSAPSSRWREITGYRDFVYSVSEHHRGIRVIDMTNPTTPVDRGYVLSSNIVSSHSISVDPDAGRLYVNGTNLGLVILDVSSTPAAPTILAATTAHGYVHDSFIRRGRGYFAQLGSGLGIFDVANPASLRELVRFPTPATFTHNTWVSDDDKLLVTTDEIGSGGLAIFDIANLNAPVLRGTYNINNQDICHNAFLIGRACYMAHNSAGLHVADLADPTAPVAIARYDTSTTTSGYNGSWGCYPFQDSGVVYSTDRDNGLFVVQIDCGNLHRYGRGTAPQNHAVPRLSFDGGTPRLGVSQLALRIGGLQPNAPFWLVLSSGSVSPYTLLGVEVHIDLNGAVWVRQQADGSGRATLAAPVPGDPRLGGARFYMQVFAADGSAASGVSASRGMWAGICR
jgi:choice-of-anchor B domain-containing protein